MVNKAILLNLNPQAAERRLAGLPLLLRALVGAQRAGIEEIRIVGGPDPARLLGRDKRVRVRWSWQPLPGHEPLSELDALRRTLDTAGDEFILLFSDSVFSAQALRALRQAGLEGQLLRAAAPAGRDGLERASLFLCAPGLARALDDAGAATTVGQLAVQLRARGQCDTVAVEAGLWPRTGERAALRAVQRELTHFKLKPSDGIFARFTKLVVAEPLIRLLVHTPATPNFITGMGLALAIASGLVFAQGGYWWCLGGALLAYLSAVMDHIDGMVARLKFLESKFGVWFESAADFGSYLLIFSGLALGLYREQGSRWHLLLGGLVVLGTILGFVTISRQRMLSSADNPTDYPNRIHAKLEEKRTDVLHWFTRKFYFLTRRAVLPYFIVLFCLLDLRVLLLGWVTFGANLVWALTLYNNRLFRHHKAAADAD